MIVTRKACKCAICTHEWLPSRTRSNPKADPRKVKRCASCKSFQWNADDPKLLAARLAKVELPKVAPEVPEYSYSITAITGVKPARTSAICRHRVLLAHCELCNAVEFTLREARP